LTLPGAPTSAAPPRVDTWLRFGHENHRGLAYAAVDAGAAEQRDIGEANRLVAHFEGLFVNVHADFGSFGGEHGDIPRVMA
jgi:hypothetical protein